MKVTLTGVLDPDRRIVSIKALRDAARGCSTYPDGVMGLKQAKDTVDALARSFSAVVDVEVADLAPLDGFFTYETKPGRGIHPDLVLDFVLDVLSCSEPHVANSIRTLPSYQRIKEAL